MVADRGAGNGLAGQVTGIVRGAGFKNVKRAPLGAREVISWPVLGIVRAAAVSSAEAAIVSNSNGIVVVSVISATAGRRSRLGITVLWPPRQWLKGNAPALNSSTPGLRCAEADEINWAVSASLGTLQMIEADYQFDVNFA